MVRTQGTFQKFRSCYCKDCSIQWQTHDWDRRMENFAVFVSVKLGNSADVCLMLQMFDKENGSSFITTSHT